MSVPGVEGGPLGKTPALLAARGPREIRLSLAGQTAELCSEEHAEAQG